MNYSLRRHNGNEAGELERKTPHRRRSLRVQHSMSLHIPLEELNSTITGMNCFIDLPRQVFSLTYLEVDETQNPESLNSLEVIKQKKWKIYLAGILYNFNYRPAQLKSLCRALDIAFSVKFENSNPGMTFHSEVAVSEEFNPTENDNQALVITVEGRTVQKKMSLYKGYLMSWCNPAKNNETLLPILLCHSPMKYLAVVHSVLCERFDFSLNKLILTQEDFTHLSTYCIVMLDENDSYNTSFFYKIPPGTIHFTVSVGNLLKLWKKIHKEENNEVDLDEIMVFHEALSALYESTFGIKLGYAHFTRIVVQGVFSLDINSEMWMKSTRIIHVVLKYLNFLAVQKLKVKALS